MMAFLWLPCTEPLAGCSTVMTTATATVGDPYSFEVNCSPFKCTDMPQEALNFGALQLTALGAPITDQPRLIDVSCTASGNYRITVVPISKDGTTFQTTYLGAPVSGTVVPSMGCPSLLVRGNAISVLTAPVPLPSPPLPLLPSLPPPPLPLLQS